MSQKLQINPRVDTESRDVLGVGEFVREEQVEKEGRKGERAE